MPALEYDWLFDRKSGWTGADGTYSVPVSPTDTLWLFSDTFWGELDEHGLRLPGFKMIHNSAGRQRRERLEFAGPLFEPPDGKGWFWVYDGLPQEGKVEVLLGQFAPNGSPDPTFNFEQIGNWMADLDLATMKASNYRKLPYLAPDAYGASILKDEDWTYVYGTRDLHVTKSLLLARCQTLAGPWEYWNGSGWGGKAEPLAPDVSNELSVHKTRNEDYLLVSQSGQNIQVRRAPQPWGPWSEAVTVYTTPQKFTYNAKAHPEISTERGLLVSYNVNGPAAEVEKDGRIYRPRFLWLRGEDW